MDQIQLFAPNGLEIVGALALNGAIRHFDYSYDRTTKVRLYVFKDGAPPTDGPLFLVDSEGNQWNSTDVEWHTLLNPR